MDKQAAVEDHDTRVAPSHLEQNDKVDHSYSQTDPLTLSIAFNGKLPGITSHELKAIEMSRT